MGNTQVANGYPFVKLIKDGKYTGRAVHRLVLEAFIGPCPDGMQACHGDGVKTHSWLSNLRWDTPKNNCEDQRKHGHLRRGQLNGYSRLSESQVVEIRSAFAAGESQRNLARRYGVAVKTINCIIRKETWAHV